MSYKKIKKGKGKPNPKNKYEIKLGTPSNLVQQKVEDLQAIKGSKRSYPDKEKIPNVLPKSYTVGDGGGVCSNCVFFYKNNCTKWGSKVRAGYYCDSFNIKDTNVDHSTYSGNNPRNEGDDLLIAPHENRMRRRSHRFFDDVLGETYRTINDHEARFGTSKGGTLTDWSGRKVKVGIELVYKDGSRNLEDVVIAQIKNIKTSRNSELATINLESVVQPMLDVSAETVKDGFDWYRNRPLSFLINELLHAVYKDSDGDLPMPKQIRGDALELSFSNNQPGFWDMGVPNSWDGIEFQDVIEGLDVTAICDGEFSSIDTSHRLYVACSDANYPPSVSELYQVEPKTNLWTKLSSFQTDVKRIKKLVYNYDDHTVYGYAEHDDINKAKDIWGQDSAGDGQTSVKTIFPNVDVIYWNPQKSSGYLDDTLNYSRLNYCFTGKTTIREGSDVQAVKYDINDCKKSIGPAPFAYGTGAINGFECQTDPNAYQAGVDTGLTASQAVEYHGWLRWENNRIFGVNTDWLIKDSSAPGVSNFFDIFKGRGPYGGPQFRGMHKIFTGPNNGHNWNGIFSQIGGWRNNRSFINAGQCWPARDGTRWNFAGEPLSYLSTGGSICLEDYQSRQGGENIALHTMGKQVFFGGLSPESVRYHIYVQGFDTYASSYGGMHESGQKYTQNMFASNQTAANGGVGNGNESTGSIGPGSNPQPFRSDAVNQLFAYYNWFWHGFTGSGSATRDAGRVSCGDMFSGQGNRSHVFDLAMIGSDPNDYIPTLSSGERVVHGLYGQVPRHAGGANSDQKLGSNLLLYNTKREANYGQAQESQITEYQKLMAAGDTSLWGYASPDKYPDEVPIGRHINMGMAGKYGAMPLVMNASPWQNNATYFIGRDSTKPQYAAMVNTNQDKHRKGSSGVGWLSSELRCPFPNPWETLETSRLYGWHVNWYSIWDDVEGRGYTGSDIPTRFQINAAYSNNQQGLFDLVSGWGTQGGIILATADSAYGGYLDHSWVDNDCVSGNQMVSGPWRKNSYEIGYVAFNCQTKDFVKINNMTGRTNSSFSTPFSMVKHNDAAGDYSTRQPTAAVSGAYRGADSTKLYLATTTYDSYTLAFGERDYSHVYFGLSTQMTIYRGMWGTDYHGCHYTDTSGSAQTTGQNDLTAAFFFNETDFMGGQTPMRNLMSLGVGGPSYSQTVTESWNDPVDADINKLAMHISIVHDTNSSGNSYLCAGHTPHSIYDGAAQKTDVGYPVSWVWTSTPLEFNTTYHVAVTRGLSSDSSKIEYQLFLNGQWQDSTVGYSIFGYKWMEPNTDSCGQNNASGGSCYGSSRFMIDSAPCVRDNTADWRGLTYSCFVNDPGKALNEPHHFPLKAPEFLSDWNTMESNIRTSSTMSSRGGVGELLVNPTAITTGEPNTWALNTTCNFIGYMWLMGLWNYKLPKSFTPDGEGGDSPLALHGPTIDSIKDLYNEGLGSMIAQKHWMYDTFLPVLGFSGSDYGLLQASSDYHENNGFSQDSLCLSFMRAPEPPKNSSVGWNQSENGNKRFDAPNMNSADEFGNIVSDWTFGSAISGATWDMARYQFQSKWNGGDREIAGADDLLLGWQSKGEMLHISENRIRALTEIHEIDFNPDQGWQNAPQITTRYVSNWAGTQEGGDESVYQELFGTGMQTYPLGGQSAANKSRNILALNYNSNMSKKIQGWSMKRDAIFTDNHQDGIYEPCNEVFTYDPENDGNKLTIVDVDMRDGSICDATQFGPFINPKNDNQFFSDGRQRVYYFRISDPNDGAGDENFFRTYPMKLSFMERDNQDRDIGCNFHDSAASPTLSTSPNNSEQFVGGQQAAIINKQSVLQEDGVEGLWFGTAHWYNYHNMISDYVEGIPGFGISAWKNPSTKRVFQFSRSTYDPIIPLGDFSDLKVFEAITKLAAAYNLMFGLDLEESFLIKPHAHGGIPDFVVDYRDGEILDIEKTVGEEIRNVIVGVPFDMAQEDPAWEIVMDSNAPEEGHFEGDIDIVAGDETLKFGARTVKSVFVCDRSGWLDGSHIVGQNMDFSDSAGDPRPLFKFLTSTSAHDCFLRHPIVSTDTLTQQSLYVSSIYKSGGGQVAPGDVVVISTDTDTSLGNIFTGTVDNVDLTYSIINLQHTGDTTNPFGIAGLDAPVETPVQVVELLQTTGGSVFESYNVATQTFSNQGISICNEDSYYDADSGIVLKVSNPKSFCPATLLGTHGSEAPLMLVSAGLGSDWLRSEFGSASDTVYPTGAEYASSTRGFGYVDRVDIDNRLVTLKPNPFNTTDYSESFCGDTSAFVKGTRINAWVMFPYDQSKAKIGSIHYKLGWAIPNANDPNATDTAINTFVQQNTRFMINTFGPKLVSNAKRTFTFSNAQSVERFGVKEYKLPTNRFLNRFWMPIVTKEILDEYAFPKYDITLKTLYKPNIKFVSSNKFNLNKVRIIDEIMFPSSPGYYIEGWIKEYDINMKTLEITLKMRGTEIA